MGALTEIQLMIYSALSTDATLNALVPASSIGDWPTPEGDYPFITIGEDSVRDWIDKSKQGYIVDCDIHIWSRGLGFKEAKAIADQIHTILTASIEFRVAASMTVLSGRFQRIAPSVCLNDPDGRTKHIKETYRVSVKEV